MDCTIAENLTMKYAEGTITPPESQGLVKHVLSCESCREFYLLFDEMLEQTTTDDLEKVPGDFTRNVMLAVKALPCREAKVKRSAGSVVYSVLWGFSVMILGLALLLVFNPTWLEVPILNTIHDGLMAFGAWMIAIGERIGNSVSLNVTQAMSLFALSFSGIIVILLHLLYSGEKRQKAV